MYKQKAIYFLLLVLSILRLYGQSITATIEPDKILIGEHAKLSFVIEVPTESMLEMPIWNEMIHEKIEILQYGTNDTIASAKNVDAFKISRTLTITSWDEGFHAIAPFVFTFVEGADTLQLESDPLLLEVEPFSIEEHTDLKDIKSIISAPITLAELKYYILGLILLGLLIWLLIRYWKKRKKKPEPESIWEKPDIPAHVAAISSLQQLKSLKLWQQGKVKEYHIRLTDIIRHYIEKRFKVRALEMTTHEIMQGLSSNSDLEQDRESLQSILQLADMVKFAKHQPLPNENEISLDAAFEFVNNTKLVVTEDDKPTKEA